MSKNICLATVDFEGLIKVGGIGSYYGELARMLKKNGWDVTVLFHHYEGNDTSEYRNNYYKEHNIKIYDVSELLQNENSSIISELSRDSNWIQARSHAFHEALQVLINRYNYTFDLIEFSDWGAAGYIPIQMNKNFKLYNRSKIIVKLHGSWEWHNEGCGQTSLSIDDLKLNYMEKYAFDNADIQVAPTRHILDWANEHGWSVRPDASLCRNPISLELRSCPSNELIMRNEIIFFGRYEERKGIKEFIHGLKYIQSNYPHFSDEYKVTFIGKEGSITINNLKRDLLGFNCNFFTFPHNSDAIEYLINKARLVVIPSKLDNFPNTVLECMYNRIPFITSRSGGIPEILGIGSDLYKSISCDITNSRNLGDLILKYLDYDEAYIKNLLDSAFLRLRCIAGPEKIVQWYEKLLNDDLNAFESTKERKDDSWVTIIIPSRNLTTSKYLETTLDALMNQTFKNLKIIVKDSSTDMNAISTLEKLRDKYKNVRFIHQMDSSVGNAMNQALSHVDTKYVMQVDGDNIGIPDMVETFAKCIENQERVAALSCYFAAFLDNDEKYVLKSIYNNSGFYKPHHYYKPIGPCLPALFFENTQGDANSIFKTDVVKSIGGWPEGREGFPDWGLWIKLLSYGYGVDVIPKVLFYYRDYPQSDAKTKDLYNIDKVNIELVKIMIRNRPEWFSNCCYEYLHRLIRNSGVGPEGQELMLVKNSALYAIGEYLGKLANAHSAIKMLFVESGNLIKKVIR